MAPISLSPSPLALYSLTSLMILKLRWPESQTQDRYKPLTAFIKSSLKQEGINKQRSYKPLCPSSQLSPLSSSLLPHRPGLQVTLLQTSSTCSHLPECKTLMYEPGSLTLCRVIPACSPPNVPPLTLCSSLTEAFRVHGVYAVPFQLWISVLPGRYTLSLFCLLTHLNFSF